MSPPPIDLPSKHVKAAAIKASDENDLTWLAEQIQEAKYSRREFKEEVWQKTPLWFTSRRLEWLWFWCDKADGMCQKNTFTTYLYIFPFI